MPRDILYYVGAGSKWDNNELRFSLRSVEKYCKNIGKIYIVGEKPDTIEVDGGYLEYPDGKVAYFNSVAKITAAVTAFESMTDDFWVMMDDVFFCDYVDLDELGYYIRSKHLKTKNTNHWGQNIKMTGMILRGLGLKDRNFEEHSPFLLNKEKWIQMKEIFDFQTNLPWGLAWRSLYGNRYKINGTLQSDMKLRGSYIEEHGDIYEIMEDLLKDRYCFSIDDTCINLGMNEWLEKQFPNKSKWEK